MFLREEHEPRITDLEKKLKELGFELERQREEGAIDYSKITMRADFDELLLRFNLIEGTSVEEKLKLKTETQRIDEMMGCLQEPIDRLNILDDTIDALGIEIKNKVSLSDMYTQLKTKASLEKVKTIE